MEPHCHTANIDSSAQAVLDGMDSMRFCAMKEASITVLHRRLPLAKVLWDCLLSPLIQVHLHGFSSPVLAIECSKMYIMQRRN